MRAFARRFGLVVIALALVGGGPARAQNPEVIPILYPGPGDLSNDAGSIAYALYAGLSQMGFLVLPFALSEHPDISDIDVYWLISAGPSDGEVPDGQSPGGHLLGVLPAEIAILHWQGLTELTFEDYTPLALFNADAAGLLVRADSEWQSAQEVLAAMEAAPGAYKASGTGQGGIWHLALAGMLQEAGIALDAVPWMPRQDAAAALQDLVAGGVDIVVSSMLRAQSLLDAGRVKSLAVMSVERDPAFPEVPTLKQATGLEWTAGAWHAIVGPKSMSQGSADRFVALLKEVHDSQDPRDLMARRGLGVAWLGPADLREWMAASDASLGSVIQSVPAERDRIEVVASGAVAPLLARVARRFGAATGRLEPTVSETIDYNAVAEFCAGAGDDDPDLLGIARRLRPAELDDCAAAGVDAVSEIKLGYEALVLATSRAEPKRDIDLAELWLAFTPTAPAEGIFGSSGPLVRWTEVDPEQPEGDLPDDVGMPGRRQLDALIDLGLSRGCLAFPAVEASPFRGSACSHPRPWGTVELPENELPMALDSGVIDLALMTFAGFDAQRAALKPFRINGVQPSAAGIRNGSYALARPLYVYVKLARAGVQAGLESYLEALTAEAALANSGDLGAEGLVPLSSGERQTARQAAHTLPILALDRPDRLAIPPIDQYNPGWSWASAVEMTLRHAGLPALSPYDTYRCSVVAARFDSCEPDCAACLSPVATARSLVSALDAYQAEALALRLAAAPVLAPEAAGRLTPGALGRMIRKQRRPVLAQVMPRGARSFYPPGMTSHFALIVGIAGTGKQARLTVNDPYPYPEAANPYLATGARTGEPGQYAIRYGDFRRSLGYRASVVLR